MDGPLRALVVDDSAVIRDLIKVNLELEGFDVTTAEDGAAALAVICDVDPHVVTLDVVTAQAQAADRQHGQGLGVDAYVTKPFEPAHLVEVVTRFAVAGRPPPADTLGR